MRTHRIITLLFSSILILTLLAGCNQTQPATTVPENVETQVPMETEISTEAPESGPITVTDSLGRTVELTSAPQRIVLTGKSLFMVADAIFMFPEAGNRVVALASTVQGNYDFISMIDPNYSSKIIFEDSSNVEDVIAQNPDLVIMKSMNQEKLGTPLEELGIPVVYLNFENPDQYQTDLVTLGQVFQNPERAQELSVYFQTKFDNVKATVADTEKPSVLVLYYNEKDGTVAFNVPPVSWMQTLMVEAAGGVPVWKDANPGQGWTTVTIEQIATWNPDYIFVTAYFANIDEVVANLKADAQWQQLDAVKNGTLYAFAKDTYAWDQPDPRWILGTQWMAKKLHPDLFADLGIIEEAQSFYADLYYMDASTFQSTIQSIMTGDIK